MAEVLRTDLSREILTLPNDEEAAFDLVAKHIDGHVTRFRLANGGAVAVDEDGIPRQLPLNPLATALVRDTVLGTAVVLSRDEARLIFG